MDHKVVIGRRACTPAAHIMHTVRSALGLHNTPLVVFGMMETIMRLEVLDF